MSSSSVSRNQNHAFLIANKLHLQTYMKPKLKDSWCDWKISEGYPVVKLRGNAGNGVPLPLFEGERRAPSTDGHDGWTVGTRRTPCPHYRLIQLMYVCYRHIVKPGITRNAW